MTVYAKRLKRKKLFFIEANGVSSAITVWVQDATQDVWMQGHALHIINGAPGKTFGCGLANCATDKDNKNKFPHSVTLASFLKSAAFIITADKRDGFNIAIRYEHSYGQLVDLNDERVSQELATKDPEFFERIYHLRIPKLSKHVPNRTNSKPRTRTGSHRAFIPRGGLARALTAGLVTPDFARIMLRTSRVHNYERKTTEQVLRKRKRS